MAYGFDDGRRIDVGSVQLSVVDRGAGHPVVLVHGFPELAYSWRHQLPALAGAGYRAIAYDVRGFGRSDKPEATEAYRLQELIDDYVGLLDALGIEAATLVGHDWGGIMAWAAALTVPERISAVVSLNVPYRGHCAGFPNLAYLQQHAAERFGYVLFFQEPGQAETWFEADPDGVLSRFYAAAAATGSLQTEAEFTVYRDAFVAGGVTGPLGLYRNLDANWEAFEHLAQAVVEVPALMVAADRDPVLPASLTEGMDRWVSDLQVEVIENCGHWTQQEQPDAVNRVLIDFLDRRVS